MVNGPVPVFDSVTSCVGAGVVPTWTLLKARLVVLALATGATPSPVRLISCWLPATPLELSVMVTEPVRTPMGPAVEPKADDAGTACARVVPQPPASLENPVPATTMLAIDKIPSPVFDSVTVCVAELVLRLTLPKSTLVLDRLANGAAPLPVTGTVRSGPLLVTVIVAVTAAFVVGANLTTTLHVAFLAKVLFAQVVDKIVNAALLPADSATGLAPKTSERRPMLVTVIV
jgi:hypothetical protein